MLSLSRIIYLVGGDSVEIYDNFFKQQTNIKATYEGLSLKKPSLPPGMTTDMGLAYDEIVKVEDNFDLFNVFPTYPIILNYTIITIYRKLYLGKMRHENLFVPKSTHCWIKKLTTVK